MLVFRDGARRVALRPLLEQLVSCCRGVSAAGAEARLEALLRAGELECALADEGSAAAEEVGGVTDALADAVAAGSPESDGVSGEALRALEAVLGEDLPETGRVSVPEGFAYYALHPMDYAEAISRLPRNDRVVVIGIRSIGTTLSAVVRAELARRGVEAERFTVRPTGHPWDRETSFTPEQSETIARATQRGAGFLVVDEGPGLSGSSFLSVAEALEAAGAPRERITLLGSHAADAARLCARGAAVRWPRFRFVSVGATSRVPAGDEISGGGWRDVFLPQESDWPASWTSFERRKFLSRDGRTLYKFEGLGHYGEAVVVRARRLAELGFAPQVRPATNGFAAYERVPGQPMRAAEVDESVLRRLADYCAARAENFPADEADTAALAQLVEVNWREAFGEEMAAPPLAAVRPVIADGRMQPHEWVRANDGKMLKTDGASHGDDHFFPGPTDIAWDLAGAIVEWQMSAAESDFFLREYERLSGDDAADRLPAYLLAYTLFRLGYCEMAAEAMRENAEEMRLRREGARYRQYVRELRGASVAA